MATDTRSTIESAPIAGPFTAVRTAVDSGITLGYREQGEGEPVVFVYGSAGDLRTWEQQLPAIGSSHRAIAYSRRYARPNEDIAPGADDLLPELDRIIEQDPAAPARYGEALR